MMQFFRSAAKPMILVTTIAFFIWLVYDLSGLGGGGGLLTKTSVGKVNGTSIDARTFQTAVEQATQARQRQTGASLSLEEVAQVRNQVWEQYVQDIIFRAEYERRGIRASTEEITEAIRLAPPRELLDEPTFQTDGKFDPTKYQRWLQSSASQPYLPGLEARYRDDILRTKLLRGVIGDIYLSDASLWERYRDEKEMVKVGALVIDPATAVSDAEAPVTAQEVEGYYRAHREEFNRTPAAFLSYLALPRLPDASDTAAAMQRARALRAEIAGGVAFAEVARRESADTISGKNGGDLGEMSKSVVDSAFGAAAMSLPLKTLSEPVRSNFGFHLIEVESRKGDTFKARHILIPIEVAGAHREALDRRADSLEQLGAERLEGGALDTAAAALRLQIRKAGPVTEATRISLPDAGVVPDVSVWAFQAKPGEVSPVLEGSAAYALFRLDSAQAGGIAPLERIRPEVERKARLAKKATVARELGKRLAEDARKAGSLKGLGGTSGRSYREIGPFARLTAPLSDPALIGTAFSAEKGQIAGPAAAEDGVYLFEVLEHTAADSAEFAKTLPQVRAQAIQAARQSRVRAYVAALRAAAKIVDRRAEIYRTSAQNAANAPTPVR